MSLVKFEVDPKLIQYSKEFNTGLVRHCLTINGVMIALDQCRTYAEDDTAANPVKLANYTILIKEYLPLVGYLVEDHGSTVRIDCQALIPPETVPMAEGLIQRLINMIENHENIMSLDVLANVKNKLCSARITRSAKELRQTLETLDVDKAYPTTRYTVIDQLATIAQLDFERILRDEQPKHFDPCEEIEDIWQDSPLVKLIENFGYQELSEIEKIVQWYTPYLPTNPDQLSLFQ